MATYTRPDATYPAIAEDGGRTPMSPADVGAGWSTVSQTRPPAATFNARDYLTSSATKYLCRLGVAEYSHDEQYQGLGTCIGSDGSFYWNLVACQGIDPVGDLTGHWEKMPVRLRDAQSLAVPAGGPAGAVQFNDFGGFAGSAGFIFHKTDNSLGVSGNASFASGCIIASIGGGYVALGLNNQVQNGLRCGLCSSAGDQELYLDTASIFTFQNHPTIFAKLSNVGLSIGNFPGSPLHSLDIGGAAGVVAYINSGGDGVFNGTMWANQFITGSGAASSSARMGFSGTTAYFDSYGADPVTLGNFAFRSLHSDGTGLSTPFEIVATTGDFWFRTQGTFDALHIDHGGNAVFGGNVFVQSLQTGPNGVDIQASGGHFQLHDDGGSSFIDGAHGGRLLLNNNVSGGVVQINGTLYCNGSVVFTIAGKTYAAPQIVQVTGVGLNQVHQNTSTMSRQQSITYTTQGSSTGFVTVNVGPTNPPSNQVFRDENTASVNGAEVAITLVLPPGWYIQVVPGSGEVTGIGRWWEWDVP